MRGNLINTNIHLKPDKPICGSYMKAKEKVKNNTTEIRKW